MSELVLVADVLDAFEATEDSHDVLIIPISEFRETLAALPRATPPVEGAVEESVMTLTEIALAVVDMFERGGANRQSMADLKAYAEMVQRALEPEIYDAPEPTDRQVWGVCPYLRDSERCRGCPPWEDIGPYGRGKRGCRAMAEEACRIVMAALPPAPEET